MPSYEPLEFTLNPQAQRALAALAQGPALRRMEKMFEEAQAAVSNAAAEINDRAHDSGQHAKRRRDGSAQGEEDDTDQQRLVDMRRKVDAMTKRMDERMCKLIDGRHYVQSIKDSVSATAEESRANASTQASTQNVRSQRRTISGQADEDDEDEDDDAEYPEITPTDPSVGTQALQPAIDMFRTKLETSKSRYQSHSLASRYTEDNDYIAFRRVVHDAQHQDDGVAMPHPSEWFTEREAPAPGVTCIRTNANDGDDSDDDIAVSRATISTKCPLTLQEFKQPLTSKKCPHSFESEAIMSMINASELRVGGLPGPRGRVTGGERAVQCPVPGCAEQLTKGDMHTDPVLMRKIKRMQRAIAMAAEDGSDDGTGPRGDRTQRAQVIDDEDGADVDAIVDRRTQMKAEIKSTASSRPAASRAIRTSTAPVSTAPVELGGSSDEDESMDE